MSRLFTVAVVGVSGVDSEVGIEGVGKSCLCNRFVRPNEDEFYPEHISTVSQVDFNGSRVINGDHWLYWGDRQIMGDDASGDMIFRIIEQTEFCDDESFATMKGNGGMKVETYAKRASQLKLHSPDKLMYIMKEQLGVEQDYDQISLPDSRAQIDGFVCVFDLTECESRSTDRQMELLSPILQALAKTKKPIVCVTTKHDAPFTITALKQAEKLMSKQKGLSIPIVESSAVKGVNVDSGFLILAHMIDKTRSKPKIVSFVDAERGRNEVLQVAFEAFRQKLRVVVQDHRMNWTTFRRFMYQEQDMVHFCELFGELKARQLFLKHQGELRDRAIMYKLQMHVQKLEPILKQFIPDLMAYGNMPWDQTLVYMRTLPKFQQFFQPPGDLAHWVDNEVLHGGPMSTEDTRLPAEVLQCPEAEFIFKRSLADYESQERVAQLQSDFLQLLKSTSQVTPGKPLDDVKIFLMGNNCFESLSENDINYIYDHYQSHIQKKAMRTFTELLLDSVDEFVSRVFSDSEGSNPTDPSQVAMQSSRSRCLTDLEIQEIHSKLQEDSRYRHLNRLPKVREDMVTRYMYFCMGALRHQCPAYPRCVDQQIDQYLSNFASNKQTMQLPPAPEPQPTSGYSTHSSTDSDHLQTAAGRLGQPTCWLLEPMPASVHQMNLVLLGAEEVTEGLQRDIRVHFPSDEFESAGERFSIKSRVYDAQPNSNAASVFRGAGFYPNAIICAFSSRQSLKFADEALDRTILSSSQTKSLISTGEGSSVPLVVLLACDPAHLDDLPYLQQQGAKLSERLQCEFVGVVPTNNGAKTRDRKGISPGLFSAEQLLKAFRASLLGARRYRAMLEAYDTLMPPPPPPPPPFIGLNVPPALRIQICLLCGDDFSLHSLVDPLLKHWVESPPAASSGSGAPPAGRAASQASSASFHSGIHGPMGPSPVPSYVDPVRMQPILEANRVPRSLFIEALLPQLGSNVRIEVSVVAYHTAFKLLAERQFYSGYILAYSAKRSASFAHLECLANMVPDVIPMYFVVVGEVSEFFSDPSTNSLITKGNEIADRCGARFSTVSKAMEQQITLYTPFFEDVYARKNDMERSGIFEHTREKSSDSLSRYESSTAVEVGSEVRTQMGSISYGGSSVGSTVGTATPGSQNYYTIGSKLSAMPGQNSGVRNGTFSSGSGNDSYSPSPHNTFSNGPHRAAIEDNPYGNLADYQSVPVMNQWGVGDSPMEPDSPTSHLPRDQNSGSKKNGAESTAKPKSTGAPASLSSASSSKFSVWNRGSLASSRYPRWGSGTLPSRIGGGPYLSSLAVSHSPTFGSGRHLMNRATGMSTSVISTSSTQQTNRPSTVQLGRPRKPSDPYGILCHSTISTTGTAVSESNLLLGGLSDAEWGSINGTPRSTLGTPKKRRDFLMSESCFLEVAAPLSFATPGRKGAKIAGSARSLADISDREEFLMRSVMVTSTASATHSPMTGSVGEPSGGPASGRFSRSNAYRARRYPTGRSIALSDTHLWPPSACLSHIRSVFYGWFDASVNGSRGSLNHSGGSDLSADDGKFNKKSKPGKLKLAQFDNLKDALGRPGGESQQQPSSRQMGVPFNVAASNHNRMVYPPSHVYAHSVAPLATPEKVDLDARLSQALNQEMISIEPALVQHAAPQVAAAPRPPPRRSGPPSRKTDFYVPDDGPVVDDATNGEEPPSRIGRKPTPHKPHHRKRGDRRTEGHVLSPEESVTVKERIERMNASSQPHDTSPTRLRQRAEPIYKPVTQSLSLESLTKGGNLSWRSGANQLAHNARLYHRYPGPNVPYHQQQMGPPKFAPPPYPGQVGIPVASSTPLGSAENSPALRHHQSQRIPAGQRPLVLRPRAFSHDDPEPSGPISVSDESNTASHLDLPGALANADLPPASPGLMRRMATSFRFKRRKHPGESKSTPQSPTMDRNYPRGRELTIGQPILLVDDNSDYTPSELATSLVKELDDDVPKDLNDAYPRHNEWFQSIENAYEVDQLSVPVKDLLSVSGKSGAPSKTSPKNKDDKRKTSQGKKSSVDKPTMASMVNSKLKKKSKDNNAMMASSIGIPSTILPGPDHNTSLEDLVPNFDLDPISIFVRKCVEFIEIEGFQTEGLYRVPGNQAHVVLLEQKFQENPDLNFEDLDIPVHAAATALKNFLANLQDSVLPNSMYDSLMEAMTIGHKPALLMRLREVLKGLPKKNMELLKYFIIHLRKVAEHSEETSMDHRNLAKCFWPTLVRPNFEDFESMAQMTQRLEELMQLILQYFDFLLMGCSTPPPE